MQTGTSIAQADRKYLDKQQNTQSELVFSKINQLQVEAIKADEINSSLVTSFKKDKLGALIDFGATSFSYHNGKNICND